MRTMKKRAKKVVLGIVIAIVAIVVVLVVALEFAAGPIVKGAAETAGPLVLGTEVAISNADIHVISGKINLGGVVVGAPEGFDANLFEMDTLKVDIDTSSLIGGADKPIVIHEILVEEPIVTYELKGLHDNLHALLGKLGASDKEDEEENDDDSPDKPGRKVVIEHFKFDGGRVRVAMLNGKGVIVPLPTIELNDIGAKNGGITGIEATVQVVKSIVVGTLKAVAGVVGDVGGLAVEGVEAVGGLAVDGVKAVGGAAVGGVKAIGGAIGGLFGGSDGDEDAKAEDAKMPQTGSGDTADEL